MPSDSTSSNVWSQGPDKFTLARGQVHIWRLSLDPHPAGQDQALLALLGGHRSALSSDEVARASRFHFDTDRARFELCRTALRFLLGRYQSIPPREIRFTYSAAGKPELAADQNPQALRFNVSHSDNTALIAIGLHDALGVDIEKIRLDVNATELSERFFSERERSALRYLPEAVRITAFYACWARKESFLKATGDGLGFPLSAFSVSVDPDQKPHIEEINGDAASAQHWTLLDLDAAPGFRASVAIECNGASIATFALYV